VVDGVLANADHGPDGRLSHCRFTTQKQWCGAIRSHYRSDEMH
jgi:hypothetical protein